jgi:hypothetical protein
MARTRAAWILAIVADVMQVALLPLFGEGFLSPAMDALDVVVAIGMVVLLGWHLAFLPTAIAEVIPALNIFPTWTAAVFFVTRSRRKEVAGDKGAGNQATPSALGERAPESEARRKELPPGAR